MAGKNYFGPIDYIVVSLTFIISLGIGLYYAVRGRGKETSEELLMGGRNMKSIPIAMSMIVTYFSAVAIIGFPAEIYANGIQIFWIKVILTIVCIPLAAIMFMTVLFKLKLTSAYEYFELRFDSILVRCLGSGLFILQMTTMTGVALYAPSIALEAFLGMPKWISIVVIGVSGTLYTTIGGLKAVVWTDAFQFCLIIIGMITIVARGFVTAGGIEPAFRRAYEHGRLQLFNWNIDPFERYNTLNFVMGYSIAIICFYGTHQPNVQRYSSLPCFKDAIKTMVWNFFLKEIINLLIICTGVAIFATYATCDPILAGEISKADEIVPHFFIKELSWLPGMMGLFSACIISAVLSTVSSALNSLSAVTWEDFLSRIPFFQSMTIVQKGRVTCVLCALYGMVTIGLAFVAGNLGSIFQITITLVGAFGGTLGGVFIMGMFMPCVNRIGASAGMLLGLFSTGLFTYQGFVLKIPYATLPTSIEGCDTNFTETEISTNFTLAPQYNEWPTKLFTISYILYPCIGSSMAILSGVLISLISRRFITTPKNCYDYIHPLVQRYSASPTEEKLKRSELSTNDLIQRKRKVLSSHEYGNGDIIGLRMMRLDSI